MILGWWQRRKLERKRKKLCEEYGICPIHATPMTYWGSYRYQTHCDGCLRDSQEKHRLELERQVIQNRLDREARAIARSAAASVVANLNKKLG